MKPLLTLLLVLAPLSSLTANARLVYNGKGKKFNCDITCTQSVVKGLTVYYGASENVADYTSCVSLATSTCGENNFSVHAGPFPGTVMEPATPQVHVSAPTL